MTLRNDITTGAAKAAERPTGSFYDHGVSQSTLQAMVAVLAFSDLCPQTSGASPVSAFIDAVCSPNESFPKTSLLGLCTGRPTARIAKRALLTDALSYANRYRENGLVDVEPSESRPLRVAAATLDFVSRGNSNAIGALLNESDIYRSAVPVIDALSDIDGSYLVGRVPPHLGHGVTRYVTVANAESVRGEMEWEARQDRVAAASLVRSLASFVTDPTPDSLRLLLKLYSRCGEWRSWLAEPARPGTAHADAEQVIGKTVVLFESFQRFSADYVRPFSSPPSGGGGELLWFERDVNGLPGGPPLLPLYAGILEILAQNDLFRLMEAKQKYCT
mgnify:CR=1 FL=1